MWVSSGVFNSSRNKRDENEDGLIDEDVTSELWQGKKMGVNEMKDAVKEFLLED
jgi:hypothetical protein